MASNNRIKSKESFFGRFDPMPDRGLPLRLRYHTR